MSNIMFAQMCHILVQICGLSHKYKPSLEDSRLEIQKSLARVLRTQRGCYTHWMQLRTLRNAAQTYLAQIPTQNHMQGVLTAQHIGYYPQFIAEILPMYKDTQRFLVYLIVNCFSLIAGGEAIPNFLILLSTTMLQYNYYMRVFVTRALVFLGESVDDIKQYMDYIVLSQRSAKQQPAKFYERFDL